MWATPRHHRPSTPYLLPQMAALLHQPLDPFLGRVAPAGPRMVLTATANDLKQVSCFWIPNTFIDTLPSKAKVNIRYRVAWF